MCAFGFKAVAQGGWFTLLLLAAAFEVGGRLVVVQLRRHHAGTYSTGSTAPGVRGLSGGTWNKSCKAARVGTFELVPSADGKASSERFTAPRIVERTVGPAAVRLHLALPIGFELSSLASAAPALAHALASRSVEITPDPVNASRAYARVVWTDPLETPITSPWPGITSGSSFLDGVAIGIDEDGQVVKVDPAENNFLVGGEPGGGKSVLASQLVASAALDPSVRLVLIDGKRVELALFRSCAEEFACTMEEALTVLAKLHVEMFQRYDQLAEIKERKVKLGSDFPPIFLVIDELSVFTTGTSAAGKKQAETFVELLRQLVALGRAAGIIVMAATQKPDASTVPTAVRDLIRTRIALRCTTPQASDTILGAGQASMGYSAGSIPQGQPGTALLLSEGSTAPMRLRSFYLSDDDLKAIAARGAEARTSLITAPTAVPTPRATVET